MKKTKLAFLFITLFLTYLIAIPVFLFTAIFVIPTKYAIDTQLKYYNKWK